MQLMLLRRGISRPSFQTPLEFAFGLHLPEAILITEKYHQVRFGSAFLSQDEFNEIEGWLNVIENAQILKTDENG